MTSAIILEEASTVDKALSADKVPARLENDAFEYGWREIRHTLPNGETRRERIPLTLQDILHPQVGDFRLHTEEHERLCIYLYNILTMQLANDPLAVVLHDTRVAWADPEIEPHGP